jgi:hypothetical protein
VNRFSHELFRALLFIRDNWAYICRLTQSAAELHGSRMHRISSTLERAYNAEVWVKGPNKNRISIAFSIERNSGMDSGDPATAFVVLAVG